MSRDERGQSTVELALCLPFVIVLLAAMVAIGRVAVDRVRLWHGAREAARVAAVDDNASAIRAAAESAGIAPIEIEISPRGIYRRPGDPVTVRLRHNEVASVPLIGRVFDLDLTADAAMRIEQP